MWRAGLYDEVGLVEAALVGVADAGGQGPGGAQEHCCGVRVVGYGPDRGRLEGFQQCPPVAALSAVVDGFDQVGAGVIEAAGLDVDDRQVPQVGVHEVEIAGLAAGVEGPGADRSGLGHIAAGFQGERHEDGGPALGVAGQCGVVDVVCRLRPRQAPSWSPPSRAITARAKQAYASPVGYPIERAMSSA